MEAFRVPACLTHMGRAAAACATAGWNTTTHATLARPQKSWLSASSRQLPICPLQEAHPKALRAQQRLHHGHGRALGGGAADAHQQPLGARLIHELQHAFPWWDLPAGYEQRSDRLQT